MLLWQMDTTLWTCLQIGENSQCRMGVFLARATACACTDLYQYLCNVPHAELGAFNRGSTHQLQAGVMGRSVAPGFTLQGAG